jgi:hypothetical protein
VLFDVVCATGGAKLVQEMKYTLLFESCDIAQVMHLDVFRKSIV